MKRSKTSKAWMQEHVNDPFVKRAKQEGYRSRAAYKLLEIDGKDRLFRPGIAVVDLGAAPGGWCQVAAERLDGRGRIVALDLLEMDPVPGVAFIQGDFREDAVLRRLEAELGGQKVDLVISDMAPNMSGVAMADRARCEALAELALDFAVSWLKPGGNFLVKVFHGGGFEPLMKALRQHFAQAVVRKPKASRDRSSEVYLLGKGFRPEKDGAEPS